MTKKNKILIGVGIAGIAAYYLWKSRKKTFSNFSQIDYNVCIEQYIASQNALTTKVNQCMAANPTSGMEKCCIQSGGTMVNGVCSASTVSGPVKCCNQVGGVLNGTICSDPKPPDIPQPTCTGGRVYNLTTQQCECPAGTMFNAAIGQCEQERVTLPTESDCTKSGGIWNASTSTCTPCADATHMVYNGVCMTDEQVKCITQLGGDWINGTCVCPAGTTADANGICQEIINADTICPTNEVLVNGACVCPTGFHREVQVISGNETMVCVKDSTSGSGTTGGTTTTITSFPPFPYLPGLPSGDSGAGGGGGGKDENKTDLFDWIPWILAGMTTALSVVSEQKQQG